MIPNLFNEEPKPPFNCMVGLIISGDRIFLCGGTSYEEDQVSNESFIFNIP